MKQLQTQIETHLAGNHGDPSAVEKELLHLAMYRPLSHLKHFAVMAEWDQSQFLKSVREVLGVHVLDPVQQKRLVEDPEQGATVISPISPQNARVGEFYTTRIPLITSHLPFSPIQVLTFDIHFPCLAQHG